MSHDTEFETLLKQALTPCPINQLEEQIRAGQAPAAPSLQPDLPMMDALDHEVLQHRDAHFGGQWHVMIEYYQNNGKGIHPEFELERLHHLATTQEQFQQDLAPLCLAGAEAEQVARSRDAYKKLRDLYDDPKTEDSPARLIADLILSEEENPQAEMDAIVLEGPKMIPLLTDLLRSETMADPLFPGYGMAPELAARCLGALNDERAVRPLFEAIGKGDFFLDGALIAGLFQLGAPAREFLLQVVQSRPLTEDNETAAIALAHFREHPEVQTICTEQLTTPEIAQCTAVRQYLEIVTSDEPLL